MFKKNKMLKLKDGGILDINIDKYNVNVVDCPTCNYSNVFIENMQVELTKINIEIKTIEDWSYTLNEGLVMKVLLPNTEEIKDMTEIEFGEWFTETITERGGVKVRIKSKKTKGN